MTRRSLHILGSTLVVGTMSLVSTVHGQVVRGQVTDSISGRPVDRGFMILLGEDGNELTRVLTSAEGQFVLHAPGPGTYRVRSERIGYRAWESNQFVLGPAVTQDLHPRVHAIPRRLATITVSDRTSCRLRKGVETELLWEEARKALVAASWSTRQDVYIHQLHRFDRELDASRKRIEREQITVQTLATVLPFVSEDAAKLSEHGFVVPREDGGWWWWGLDVDVLLDPRFHETHCFWALRGEDERARLIGLAFEPTPEQTVPEVEGTLWLDGESGELREVEYRYTNLPTSVRSDDIGGRTSFVRMPSGAWIVQQWQIQMPIVRGRRLGPPRITGFHDIGGAVLEVMTRDGEQLYESPGLVTIHGTVRDSTRSSVLDDAAAIVDTDYGAQVDSSHRYQLRALLAGEYEITTRRLEWLGYRPGRVRREFLPGDTVNVDITIPSLDTVHRHLCPRSDPSINLAIHGEIRDANNIIVQDAQVVAQWEPGVERKRETDDSGRYALCDLPRDTPITLTATSDDLEPVTVEVHFTGRDVVIRIGAERSSYYIPDRIVRLGLQLERSN